MGFMIQIEESKLDKLAENAEKMLKYGGKMMSAIEEMCEESGMGQRSGGYGNRGGQGGGSYGNRYSERGGQGGGSMGYRDDDDDEDWEMGERRGRRRRDSMGRYR